MAAVADDDDAVSTLDVDQKHLILFLHLIAIDDDAAVQVRRLVGIKAASPRVTDAHCDDLGLLLF